MLAAEADAPYRPTTSGPFVTFTAPITPAGRLLLQPIVSATFAHASLGPQGQWVGNGPQAALRHAGFTLFAEYGVAEDLAFGAQVEAKLAERLGGTSEGVGETQLFVRRTILHERGWWPDATVLGLLKLPTGNAVGRPALLGTDVRGSGTPDLTVGLDFTHGLRPVLAHADLLITQPVASAARSSRGPCRPNGPSGPTAWARGPSCRASTSSRGGCRTARRTR